MTFTLEEDYDGYLEHSAAQALEELREELGVVNFRIWLQERLDDESRRALLEFERKKQLTFAFQNLYQMEPTEWSAN